MSQLLPHLPLHSLTKALQAYFNDPTLEFYASVSWDRPSLRRALLEVLQAKGDIHTPYSQILSLETPPVSERFAISISHCESLRGFIISEKASSLGLDIESADRIRESTVARINTPEAIRVAPSSSLLWAAQEAAFKALSPKLPVKLQSEIGVSEWDSTPSGFSFRATPNRAEIKGISKGFAVQQESLIFAVFALGS